MNQAFRHLVRAAYRAGAPFGIIDSFGTDQRAYSLASAMAWLPYCGAHAEVYSRLTLRTLAYRA